MTRTTKANRISQIVFCIFLSNLFHSFIYLFFPPHVDYERASSALRVIVFPSHHCEEKTSLPPGVNKGEFASPRPFLQIGRPQFQFQNEIATARADGRRARRNFTIKLNILVFLPWPARVT